MSGVCYRPPRNYGPSGLHGVGVCEWAYVDATDEGPFVLVTCVGGLKYTDHCCYNTSLERKWNHLYAHKYVVVDWCFYTKHEQNLRFSKPVKLFTFCHNTTTNLCFNPAFM